MTLEVNREAADLFVVKGESPELRALLQYLTSQPCPTDCGCPLPCGTDIEVADTDPLVDEISPFDLSADEDIVAQIDEIEIVNDALIIRMKGVTIYSE